jgi:hypothetical protein
VSRNYRLRQRKRTRRRAGRFRWFAQAQDAPTTGHQDAPETDEHDAERRLQVLRARLADIDMNRLYPSREPDVPDDGDDAEEDYPHERT